MPEITINYLAVIVGAAIHFGIGMFWYSKSGFGKQWMAIMGIDDAKMKQMQQKGMGQTMAIAVVAALVMTWVLAWFIDAAQATTFVTGAMTGFWIWLGFLATSMLNSVLWEQKPWKFYQINTGYYLVSLLIVGGLLAVWA